MQDLMSNELSAAFVLPPLESVHHGAGAVAQIGTLLEQYGVERAILITGITLFTKTDLVEQISRAANGRIAAVFSNCRQHVPRQSVLECANMARAASVDGVISFGGGSPNDLAKAVVLALGEGVVDAPGFDRMMIKFRYPDHLEIPPMQGDALPLFAIPTTLSAGEFTYFIGITDEVRKVKDLYLDKKLMSKAVMLDPEVTLATPEWLWLSSGMRAVDHCIEALCSTTAHPVTDALAIHALKMLVRELPKCKADAADTQARLRSQVASWMSVSGLANVTLGLSHGIGHQLGARCGVPHGITSCVMMPSAMRFNRKFTGARQAWVAQIFGVDTRNLSEDRAADAAAEAVLQFTKDLGMPWRLRDVGVQREDFEGVAKDALEDMIVASNPRPVSSVDEVIQVLNSAY